MAIMKNKENHIVLTTIYVPNVLVDLYKNAKKFNHLNNTVCWVVGDLKSPDECKQICPIFNFHYYEYNTKIDSLYTSEEYQTWRLNILNREDYKCEYCDEQATDVHHSRPQKLEPGFVLDPDFGVACCERCHYKYGHKTGTECSTSNLANKICK